MIKGLMETTVIEIDTKSPSFKENKTSLEEQVKEFKSKLEKVKEGGGAETIKKHKERGKLLARERISKLIDPGSEFLEFSAMAAYDVYNNDAPSAGIITGIGIVHSKEVLIIAN